MSLKWSFLVSCSTKSNTSSCRARRNTVYIPRRVISQNWEKRPNKMQQTPFCIGVIFTSEVWKKKLCLLLMLCSDGHGAKNIRLINIRRELWSELCEHSSKYKHNFKPSQISLLVVSFKTETHRFSVLEEMQMLDEKFWKGRKVKESLYISAQNPSKVVDAKVILNLEKGLELDRMWGFFNEQFRRTTERKFLWV